MISLLTPVVTEVFLALAGMLLLVFGVTSRDQAHSMIASLTVSVLIIAIVLLAQSGLTYADVPEFAFQGMFVNDGFTLFVKLAILIIAAFNVYFSIDAMAEETQDRFEYYLLMLFSVIGMLLMVSSNSLLTLYVGIELQSLALYTLAAYRRDNAASNEAGLKYFVLGALASGILLYGISLIYGASGSLIYQDIAQALQLDSGAQPSLMAIFGLVFVLCGIAFKLSAAPFHMWTPDVYQGAPTPVTAFFAAAPKFAAFAVLVRLLLEPFAGLQDQAQPIVIVLSMASMVIASFAAIRQTSIKRLLAYSSIGHVGFALMGLAAGTEDGVTSVLFYLCLYAIMTLGAFAAVIGLRRDEAAIENLDDLRGLSKVAPLTAYGLTILFLSMAGIPVLGGFLAKLYVFEAAISEELYALVLVGVISSVVAAYYYLRLCKLMLMDEPSVTIAPFRSTGLAAGFSVATLLSLIMIAFPGALLMTYAGQAAAALF